MKIAQVSPLFESVPPKLYGGTERIVSYLTEELVKQGHEVTLFASGDSVTKAKLISPWCCSLRLQEDCKDQMAHHFFMLEMVQEEMYNFDIIHYHIDYLHFPLSKRIKVPPSLTTLHGRLDIPDIQPLYNKYDKIPLVSISDSQRKPLPNVNWVDTVYHGLPTSLYEPNYNPGQYLAFIGRFSPEKRADRAIEIAKQAGIPIKLAAKIAEPDKKYYDTTIAPLINGSQVEYIGEVGENNKTEFLGNAKAMMFLIDWPEPFGLVMIEAMACGTPVIAWNKGSVPEIIDHGVTGFIVNSMEEALEAVKRIDELDRRKIRAQFEKRFSAEAMAKNYVKVYQELINKSSRPLQKTTKEVYDDDSWNLSLI
jgi:glycosyltransferase involved in cell wall biosynthesis